MKILLLGKSGQVGFELQRSLAPLGEVVAVSHRECDISNAEFVRKLVVSVSPEVIVNAAAYTAVDKAEAEHEHAFAINAVAPGVLGEMAAKLDALVVHYSTDYVFDGTKAGFYREGDFSNPLGVYGASKLAGEQSLQTSGARYLTFRTSWVFGAHGANFVKTMLRLAREKEALNIVADQFGAPTSASLIADVTAQAIYRESIQGKSDFPYGLYHLVANGVTNWHEYACYVIEKARSAGKPIKVSPQAIHAIATANYPTPAKRPTNSRLDTQKLRDAFGLYLPDWRKGVDHVLDQILAT